MVVGANQLLSQGFVPKGISPKVAQQGGVPQFGALPTGLAAAAEGLRRLDAQFQEIEQKKQQKFKEDLAFFITMREAGLSPDRIKNIMETRDVSSLGEEDFGVTKSDLETRKLQAEIRNLETEANLFSQALGNQTPTTSADIQTPQTEEVGEGVTTATRPGIGFGGISEEGSKLVVDSMNIGGLKLKNIDSAIETKKAEKAADVTFKGVADYVQNNKNLIRTIQLFSGMIEQIKGKSEEQGGLGLVPGIKGAFNVATKEAFTKKSFGRTAAFPGQRIETGLALNNILTGQNRAIRSVIAMIMDTLPTEFDPESFVASKTAQSLTNAYKLSIGFDRSIFTPDEIGEIMDDKDLARIEKTGKLTEVERKAGQKLQERLEESIILTPQEEEIIEIIIQSVLATPASQPRSLDISDDKSVPQGDEFTTRRGNVIRRIE